MSNTTEALVAPYGTWESPIDASQVAGTVRRLNWPGLVGDELWWVEGGGEDSGRDTLMRRSADGTVAELLPAPWWTRNRLHEYGGCPWAAVAEGTAVVFTHWLDHRIYRFDLAADTAVPLTPQPAQEAGLRYADLVPGAPGELLAVRERHTDGHIDRHIVAVPLDGSAADDPPAVREVVGGSHFLANPRLSPNGRRLAWLAWDHPDMPWDATELRVGELDPDGTVHRYQTVLGGHNKSAVPAESVFQPEWADDDSLYAVADRTGWWNLYRVPRDGGEPTPLCERGEEFGRPLWMPGFRTYAVLADGRLAVTHSGAESSSLSVLDPASRELTAIDLSGSDLGASPEFGSVLSSDGHRIVTLASSATEHLAVVVVDPGSGSVTVERQSIDPAALPDLGCLPEVEQLTLSSADGKAIHANVYPPRNPWYEAPDDDLPPYIVQVHGGPTAKSPARMNLEFAYFTSRGIGVIDVNYGGSAGYGRQYRERLRGLWGIVDVQDCADAALALAEAGRADRNRLAIRGGSAGGWTVLASVTGGDTYACGVSYFGVAELVTFAADTHDFESRYLDGLIGPLPEARQIYEERSPLAHADDVRCPVLLLQGLEDEVVPPSQSEMFRDALAKKQIRHAYLAFEGEQHGFRKAETIVASVQAELSFYGQIMGFDPPGVPKLTLEGHA
ncbi:MAG: prolyl oligopeptidase family serine peptidase [Streptosporangiales bacterium]|nr:prolyl oligopeptidase family serine peptidase [Streptosporangiales bacterium]